jgi:DNA processing protein
MTEREYYLGFALVSGIGPKRFTQLLKSFKSAKNIWLASELELKAAGLGPISTQKFIDFRSKFSFSAYFKEMEQAKVGFVALCDKNYPQLLKQLDDAPIVLFTRGDFNSINFEQTIGVVGTRKITTYGTTVTKMFAADLALSGFTIVSGLAMGVDAMAGWSAINAGGKTVAVLGSGIDLCYPPVNKPLYDRIIAGGGVVVSEFPIGMQPNPGTFPSRNRIIAGLSLGVLVTEGAKDSGSLITANVALAINRPAFAIPGPITSSLSKAPLKLIEKGGKLVTSAEDIIKIFKSQFLISNQFSSTNSQKKNALKFQNLSKD